MIRTALTVAAFGMTPVVAAQDMSIFLGFTTDPTLYYITAEFNSTPPSPIVQIWGDTSFEITGDAPIRFTGYNPAYETQLGSATVTNGTTASFVGNANAFFGTPDPSNRLLVAAFRYEGTFSGFSFNLVGQNSAIFEQPPFGDVRLYQDAQGNPGTLTFEGLFPLFGDPVDPSTFDFFVPAPSTLALAPFVLVAARRRRK